MKKILICLAVMLFVTVPVFGEIGLDVSTRYTSRYIWRGMDVGDLTGLVDGSDEVVNNAPGEMISMDKDLGAGFGLNLWGYFANHSNMFEEVDYTLSYGFALGDVDLALGYTHYTFPSTIVWNEINETVPKGKLGSAGGADADEMFVGASFSKVALAPSVTWYREYGNGWNDDYWSVTGGDSFDVLGGLDYSIGAGYWASRAAVSHIDLGVAKTYEGAVAGFDMTPGLTYIALPDQRDEQDIYRPFGSVLNDQQDNHEIIFALDFARSF